MAITLTFQDVLELAPSEGAVRDGEALLRKKAYASLGRSADGGALFAECQGSAAQPYELFADLTGTKPRLVCSCPSRQKPCKHSLGLLVEWVKNPSSFALKPAPAWVKGPQPATGDGGSKPRAGGSAPKKKKPDTEGSEAGSEAAAATTEGSEAGSEAGAGAGAGAAKKPTAAERKKVEAEKKKVGGQLEALETLEQFLLDLVASGLGGLTARTVEAVEEQARRMNDAQLPGAFALLMFLADFARRGSTATGAAAKGAAVGAALSNEERLARMAGLATQLWVMIRKGKRALEGKLEEGESQGESDAALESILGRAWRLTQLQERGYWTKGRQYLELSHERSNDPVLGMADARGHLLDLADGTIVQELTRLPLQVLEGRSDSTRLRPSREGVLVVSDAALYPGAVLNRRVRWDEKGDAARELPAEPAHFARVHECALTLDAALKAFREQLKNLLAPSSVNMPALPSAVVLVKAARFGIAEGDVLVLEDPAGARLAIRDPAETPYATTENLRHAAGAFGAGSLAVRLWFHPVERVIYGQALTLFAEGKRVRLGL